MEVGESETVFSFVAAGAGVAIVDPFSLYNNRDPRIVARKFEPAVEFNVWLIRSKATHLFSLVNNFVEYTLTELQTLVATF